MKIAKKASWVVYLLLPLLCYSQNNPLGLEETPTELYKSFRVAKPNPLNSEIVAEARHESGVDLVKWLPKPGNQGPIGSCATWAVGYAVKSFQENVERGWGVAQPNHLFSPSFLYNQITNGRNVGTSFQSSFSIVINKGIATTKTMPYTLDLSMRPPAEAFEEAIEFKASSYSRVNVTVFDVKEILEQGKCVLVGIKVYSNFHDYRGGIYNTVSGNFEGGHGMVVIGYDESRQAFKLINSWGPRWGEKGYCWIAYSLFTRICQEAYVLYDVIDATPEKLAAPLNLTASRGTYNDRIRVFWDNVPNACAYRVFRKYSEDSDFESIGQTRGPVFIDNNIEPEKKYVYTVQSANEIGVSEFSEIDIGWTSSPKPVAPSPPQNLQVRSRDYKLYLKWDATRTASGYYVYRWDQGSESYRRIGQSCDEGFGESLTDKKQGSIIYYIVTAFNEGGESAASESVSFAVPKKEEEKGPKKLVPPDNISVSIDPRSRKLVLSWNAVPGAEWYIILKWSNKRTGWQIFKKKVVDTEVVDPAWRKRDYYMVVSVNRDGFSDLSRYAGYNQMTYKNSLTYDDVEEDYYKDPAIDTFFETDLFSDDEIFKIGDLEHFKGEYFDEGFFDDDTVSRFYSFFSEKRKAFEETRSRRKESFESFREKQRERFNDFDFNFDE